MKREFSAGGIVYRHHNNQLEFLLIQTKASTNPKTYWGFPKGHVDSGESSKEAAVREVREETGVEVKIVKKIGDSKYVYTRDRERIFKAVTIFLMEYLSGETRHQQEEILDAQWVAEDEVLGKLSFSNDKTLFKQALETLNG